MESDSHRHDKDDRLMFCCPTLHDTTGDTLVDNLGLDDCDRTIECIIFPSACPPEISVTRQMARNVPNVRNRS